MSVKKNLLGISLVFLLFSQVQAVTCRLKPTGGKVDKFYVGQKVEFQIEIDTQNEDISGFQFFLTIDPTVLKPVFKDGKPFERGDMINNNSPLLNSTHNDVWGEPDTKNGIPGFQLDFVHLTPPGLNGDRPTISGSGIGAYVEFLVIGIPENNDNMIELDFDNDWYHGRDTKYFVPDRSKDFSILAGFSFTTYGAGITPAIGDTSIIPGNTLEKYLGNHFFSEEFDANDAIWTYDIEQNLPGTNIILDTVDNADMLFIETENDAHGILTLNLDLGIEGSSYKTNQIWNITVNHPPKFVDPLPTINMEEDVIKTVHMSTIVTDQDDDYKDLTIEIENDSIITLEQVNNNIRFIPKENWFGNTNFNIKVADSLSPFVSKEIAIEVAAVNDYPVIDFEKSDLLSQDTLILHHDETKIINLNKIVSDVDGNEFNWSFTQNSNLDIELSEDDQLSFSVSDAGSDFYGNIPITLTVEDAQSFGASKVINVLVTSYSPVIDPINPILLHADSTRTLDLSEYVSDKDTPLDQLNFNFNVVDSTDKTIDNAVTVDFDETNYNMTISAESGHNSDNYLLINVTDNDNNSVVREVILIVVDSYAPKFVNMPTVIVYQDSIKIIDMDSYVFDVREPSENLKLDVSGNDIFESVAFENNSHNLAFKSYAEVFGSDTLKIVAENSWGLKDSTNFLAYCVPNDNKPIILDIADLNLYWKSEVEWLDLDDYVFDAFTPDSELVWTIEHTDDLFDLSKDDENVITLTTSDQTGTGSILLSVTNNLGFTKEKTIAVTVEEDQKPIWRTFQDIYLVRTQPVKTMDWNIFDKCSDAETVSENLIYSASYDNNVLDIDINSTTGEVTFSIVDTTQENTEVNFLAEDDNGNSTESQTIDIFIGDGLPPKWDNIPTIAIKNTEIFEDLRLLDYCKDPDDTENTLSFSATPSNNNIQVDVLDNSYVKIAPLNGIYGDNFFVIFTVEDSQDNLVSTSVKLIISDDLPSKGYVNYITNPVLSRRVDFVVATDESIDELDADFKKIPATSISLNFSEMNSTDDGKLWTDDYKFSAEGTYKLIIEMTDKNNMVSYDTLNMAVDFPDAGAAKIAMDKISIEYPKKNYRNKMFFLTEKREKIGNPPVLRKKMAVKKYRLQSGLAPDEALITVKYRPEKNLDNYYSFYEIKESNYEKIQTWRNKQGEFFAYLNEDCDFCFMASNLPAKAPKVPENDFICYPNPFNPTVNMKFVLKTPKEISLVVYNLLGQKIYSEKTYFKPGMHKITWSGRNANGTQMPSGVYFVLLKKNHNPMKIKKVTLFK